MSDDSFATFDIDASKKENAPRNVEILPYASIDFESSGDARSDAEFLIAVKINLFVAGNFSAVATKFPIFLRFVRIVPNSAPISSAKSGSSASVSNLVSTSCLRRKSNVIDRTLSLTEINELLLRPI